MSLVAIWCLVAFVALSALWSQSAAGAWEEAARMACYAAIWTLGLAAGAAGVWRERFGAGLVAAIGLVAVVTFLGLVVDGSDYMLAGRLDSPIGYRNATAALFAFAVWPLIGCAARWGLATGVRATCFAAVVLLLGLAFLTQSRGVVIGLVLGGAVSMLIGPDRVRRAWVAIGAVGAIAIASGPLLQPYDAFTEALVTGPGDISTAVDSLFLITADRLFRRHAPLHLRQRSALESPDRQRSRSSGWSRSWP